MNYNFILYLLLVNGGWSGWRPWSSCTRTCAGGSQRRSRTCTNPPPRNGGANCQGSNFQARQCNTNRCPGNAVVLVVLSQSIFHYLVYRGRVCPQLLIFPKQVKFDINVHPNWCDNDMIQSHFLHFLPSVAFELLCIVSCFG